MIINVRMLAFMDGDVRPVNVPDAEICEDTQRCLERVWHFGQNDFQPNPERCSVSMGDVALFRGKLWIARSFGWGEITLAELEACEKLDRHDRAWSEYTK